jgi:hypothetical protein
MGTPITHVAVDTGFSTATPEPSAWMLMACGLGFCLWVGVSVAAAVSAWMLMACGLGLLAVGRRLHPRKPAHSVHSKALALAAILVFSLRPAPAQWLNHPTPGIPRTTDGKPNLAAPAPRTSDGKPDLSGLWQAETSSIPEIISAVPPDVLRQLVASGNAPSGNASGDAGFNKYSMSVLADFKPGEAPLLPTARKPDASAAVGNVHCRPVGFPLVETAPAPFKIVQTASLMTMIFEIDTTFRQIFTDGRMHPQDPQPSYMGYSVGHWDGDTLAVDTIGLTDRGILDGLGHGHTEALRVTERFHRVNFGRTELQLTFDDPKTFTRPVTIKFNLVLRPDTDLLEFYCTENEKDLAHVVPTRPQTEK